MASKGKILLMDDEQIIIDVTLEVLRFLGYSVMFAKDGAAAVELYKKEKNTGAPFDVVILDLSIPEGMGGKEAIRQLAGVRSFRKGHCLERVYPRSRGHGSYCLWFLRQLAKPYKINDMKIVLEQLMKE